MMDFSFLFRGVKLHFDFDRSFDNCLQLGDSSGSPGIANTAFVFAAAEH